VTTRNRELRHYTAKDADADVKGMGLEDAKKLLLIQARAESNVGNNALAEKIVQVISFKKLFRRASHADILIGASLLCIGCCPSWCFHSLPLVFKQVSRTLPT